MSSLDLIRQISAKQFYYHLPEERIAFFPLEKRDESKLLVYRNDEIIDDNFCAITQYVNENTTLIFNQSKVINARLKLYKKTGAELELFCIKPHNIEDIHISQVLNSHNISYWECLIGGKKKWKDKSEPIHISLDNEDILKAYIHLEKEESTVIRFEWSGSETFNEILLQYGHTPLPPYIKRDDNESDKNRYQTVFSTEYGSVAAPTASLHFTSEIIQKLIDKNITQLKLTLHVGAGTFLPMKDEWVHQHVMHEELMECSLQLINELILKIQSGSQILAVGTTSARTLESLYWIGLKLYKNIDINWNGIALTQWETYDIQDDVEVIDALNAIRKYLVENKKSSLVTQTQIIIVPGYTFKIVDVLQTNFHQPESTLLMLVSAFIGFEKIKKIYQHAIDNNYRFLSYGDCSLLYK